MNKRKLFSGKNKEGDNWMFNTGFNGYSSQETFEHLKTFLKENGYGDIPIPEDSRRLWRDYLQPDDDGIQGSFIWHPIEILQHPYHVTGLQLNICNEFHPDHMALWEGTIGGTAENESKLYHLKNLKGQEISDYERLFELEDFLYSANIFHYGQVEEISEIYFSKGVTDSQVKELQSISKEFDEKPHFSREEKLSYLINAREFIDLYSSYSNILPFDILGWERLYWFLQFLLTHLKIQNDISENGISLKNIETCIEGITNNYLDSIISGKNTIGIKRKHSEEWDYYFDVFIGEFLNGLPHGFFVLKNEVDCIVEEAIYVHGKLLVNYSYDFFSNDKITYNPALENDVEHYESKKVKSTEGLNHTFSNISYLKK